MLRVHKSAFPYFDSLPTSLRRQECLLVRAELASQLIAYALAYELGGDTTEACLDEVAVHKRHQGYGVGTAVSVEFVAWIRERSIDRIICKPIDDRIAKIIARINLAEGSEGQDLIR